MRLGCVWVGVQWSERDKSGEREREFPDSARRCTDGKGGPAERGAERGFVQIMSKEKESRKADRSTGPEANNYRCKHRGQ